MHTFMFVLCFSNLQCLISTQKGRKSKEYFLEKSLEISISRMFGISTVILLAIINPGSSENVVNKVQSIAISFICVILNIF